MNIGSKIWERKPNEVDLINKFSEDLGLSKVTSKILSNRGLKTIEEVNMFLNPEVKNLYNPFLLKGMKEAIVRINKSIEDKESIWVYGDYDVDGITSITIILKSFLSLGYPVNYYIPNRLEEGYGISKAGIDKIKSLGGKLIISVDCGITAVSEVEYGNSLDIDFIISDHHECQSEIPNAIAVINPKQNECMYPFNMLAGAGVAFKIAQALVPDLLHNTELFKELMSISALGTVADIAPVNNENRIIVKHGMNFMHETKNVGLQKLIEVSGLKDKNITTGDIGFKLGPRINATGRVGEPALGVDLFMTNSEVEAENIATKLTNLNNERQQIEKEILEEAINIIEENPSFKDEKVLVLGKEGWHTGIIGIVASKLCDKYYKPIILLRIEDNIMKGSARSIPEFSIFDCLNSCCDYLEGFGGHEQAAGLSLSVTNFNEFKNAVLKYADDNLNNFDMISKLKIDVELESKDVNYQLLDDIEKLEPFGIANPKPVFIYKNLIVDQKRRIGKNQEHIKLNTHDGNRVFESVGFYMDIPDTVKIGDSIDLAFQVDRNSFGGVTSLQFILKDYRLLKEVRVDNDFMNKYYNTLANSLYNTLELHDAKQTFFIDFRNVKGKEKIVVNLADESRKTLILVHSPSGLNEMVRLSLDNKHSFWLENFHYSTVIVPNYSNIIVLINPNYTEIDFETFNQVILYDMPYSKKCFDYIVSVSKNVTVLYNNNDDFNMKSLIRKSIPDRNDLANIYLLIKNGQFVQSEFLNERGIEYLPNLNFSLMILETLELIQKDSSDVSKYVLNSKEQKKINLFDTEIYQSIQEIMNNFENYSKIAHKK